MGLQHQYLHLLQKEIKSLQQSRIHTVRVARTKHLLCRFLHQILKRKVVTTAARIQINTKVGHQAAVWTGSLQSLVVDGRIMRKAKRKVLTNIRKQKNRNIKIKITKAKTLI